MKKILALTLTAVMTAAMFTGCGSAAKKQTAKAASENDSKPITLRFSWWGDNTRHQATLAAIKAFEAKYPNVTIKAEYAGWDGYQTKQTTQLSGGTAADVMQLNWNWLTTYSKDGNGFYDLNKVAKEAGLSNYTKSLLNYGTMKGKLNGIPVSMTGRVLYLNKTTYDKYGVTTPINSWDDLKAAASKFKDGSYPAYIGAYDAWLISMTYAEQVTKKPFIKEDGKLGFTQKDVETALQFYQDMLDSKITPNLQTITAEGGSATAPASQLPSFLSGKYAGIFEWTSAIQKSATPLKQKGMQVVMSGIPKNSDAKCSGSLLAPSMVFGINKSCKYPKAAAKFLNFILNEPEGVKAMGTSRGVPASKAAVKILTDAGKLDELSSKGIDYLEKNPGVYYSPYIPDENMQKVYTNTMEQLSYKKLDVKGAAKYLYDSSKATLQSIEK